ncbi:MAG: DUF1614 domain-containing protein [Methanothrix sp.]|nr:DUF1614 domain-containing protein [Methanothrix sp.]
MFELLFLPLTIVIMLLILVAPLIFIYLFLRLSETAFQMVGFSHWHATLAVFGSILGSMVDFQLISAPISAYPDWYIALMSLFSQGAPATFHPLYLAVNLGGCIIPLIISAHLLLRGQARFKKALLGMAVVAVITYGAAEAIPGEGIVLPVWLSPLLAAAMGLLLAGGFRRAPPLAYISGTLGTLIGADLLSLLTPGILPALSPLEMHQTKPFVLSIGGAGVFDGIFLTGIIAVLLAAGIVCLFKGSCKGVRRG